MVFRLLGSANVR